MMNWMMKMTSQSQSDNFLAVSGDFSDDNSNEDLLLNEEQQEMFIKRRLSSSSASTPSSTSLKSRTISSLSLNLNQNSHPQTTCFYTLSPLKRWLVLPSCTLTFMIILPFINGCLYTVGYTIGKFILKMVLNKSIKN
jgi:hypothetical protein